jgi:hypothetical protein
VLWWVHSHQGGGPRPGRFRAGAADPCGECLRVYGCGQGVRHSASQWRP